MDPTSSSLPLPLWELDQEMKPKNWEQLFNIENVLGFFKENQDWVKEHEEDSKRYFSLLERTYLTTCIFSDSNYLYDQAWKIYNKLFFKYPQLFPSPSQESKKILVEGCTGETIEVPLNYLLMLSTKYRKECQRKEISDKIKKADIDDEKALVKFLNSDKQITDGNMIDLLQLATRHEIKLLLVKCLTFIEEYLSSRSDKSEALLEFLNSDKLFLDKKNVTQLFLLAEKKNIENLQSRCFAFIKDHPDAKSAFDLYYLAQKHGLNSIMPKLRLLLEEDIKG